MRDFIRPARPLGKHGTELWRSVNREYRMEDWAGSEMLLQACEALDRVSECSDEIKRKGVLIRSANGDVRKNPLLKIELAARAFVDRTLARLGLDAVAARHHLARGWVPED